MDREKALAYFNRTGCIYLMIYFKDSEFADMRPSDLGRYLQLQIFEYRNFEKAERHYNKVIEDANRYLQNCTPVYANKTTAKRCFYPYSDVLD